MIEVHGLTKLVVFAWAVAALAAATVAVTRRDA
jgi:hypothetical protein